MISSHTYSPTQVVQQYLDFIQDIESWASGTLKPSKTPGPWSF